MYIWRIYISNPKSFPVAAVAAVLKPCKYGVCQRPEECADSLLCLIGRYLGIGGGGAHRFLFGLEESGTRASQQRSAARASAVQSFTFFFLNIQ